MYHISDIKKYLRCERLYYYGKDENNAFRPYLRSDASVIDLLKEFFDIDECYEGVRNDPPERLLSELDNYRWFIYPRFADGQLRVNVPFVYRDSEQLILYFIYYGTQIKELDLLSYRVVMKVVNRSGLQVDDMKIIRFNPDYVNEGMLDPKKLFLVEDTFKGRRLIDLAKENDIDYDAILKRMEEYEPKDSPTEKTRFCRLTGLCRYYERCFPKEEKDAEDSILTLVTSQHKNRMYKEGILYLKDADPELLEGNKVQYAQVMASRNGGIFIDRLALKSWLEKISSRPISFIDFEWDHYLIPIYEKMRPLDVVCFEFALYYIDETGHMEHRTFIGTGDCRKEFVEALFKYLPDSGPILAYNAQGAECLRLKELGEIYPEYRERLDSIVDRFYDMAVPFDEGLVYDVRMEGNFSLKKLVDICSDYSYKNLDIDDGMEAVFNWRDFEKSDTEQGEKIVENLKEYCSLDAYGLFLVYKWLIELALESK